jgi:hypothetical protein
MKAEVLAVQGFEARPGGYDLRCCWSAIGHLWLRNFYKVNVRHSSQKHLTERVCGCLGFLGVTMRRIVLAVAALTIFAQAQTTTPAANEAAQGGVVLPVVLSKSLDSNKAKVGDEVTVRTAGEIRNGDAILIPRDSKLFGEVTQATARKKGDGTSTLAITFDRAEAKGGTSFKLVSTIQAVIAAPEQPMAEPPGAAAGRNPAGSRTGAGGYGISPGTSPMGASTAPGPETNSATSVGGAAGSDAQITSQTRGVVGLNNVELKISGDSAVLTSDGNSVKLDGGTRLLLHVTSVAPGTPTQPQR